EHAGRWCGPGGDQLRARMELLVLVQLGIPAAVQSHGRPQHAALQEEAEEPALLWAATEDDLVPARGVSHVLEGVLVLVGPEGVQVVVGTLVAEHRSPDVAAHLLGVVVVLDADAAEQGMKVVGAVTGRLDACDAGAAAGVDEDAVVERDGGVLERLEVELDAGPDNREIAVDAPAPLGEDALHDSVPLEGRDPVGGDQLDTLLAMDGGQGGADPTTQDAL